jgi:SH3-like domain-containing protein
MNFSTEVTMKHVRLYFLALISSLLICGNIFADNGHTAFVNVPVLDMHETASLSSKVVSQVIYGFTVTATKSDKDWSFINTDDNYSGWVETNGLSFKPFPQTQHMAKVKNLFAYVYAEPDTTEHVPLLLLPFSAQLGVVKIQDERWVKVRLVDGSDGWIQQSDIEIDPHYLTMPEMLAFSKKFVGLPYRWAGISTFGFDCSGFVQMLYRQIGVILPRDAEDQANWGRLMPVNKSDLEPGDLVYLGFDNKISHAGVYLGNNKFINITPHKSPIVQVSDLREPHWQKIYITARRLKSDSDSASEEFESNIADIPPDFQKQMTKYTWRKGCPVALSSLAYVTVSYWGFDDKVHHGIVIIHKNLANDLVAIFNELYQIKFPIQKIKPIEFYHGDDDAAMRDNNTSAFNCRAMTDFPDQYSAHSYGGAIDINPLINPYVNGDKVSPIEGKKYLDRNVDAKGKINQDSEARQIFINHGWTWGGDFRGTIKDYQHFEKSIR